ncbi:uncharacterized protein N7443_007357 [Penicillium atrosanguineum]|uniref:Glucose-methanol-choline oxidoreductase n=1 Tax=Penicillium atrosanguineum TaxID=1132637 RepID=A0A9W9PLB9_9EURO|nr:uncharacterized protein N7443_007357 [Penicillium atrosanguineum]KAJ5118428.1 Glucose-methanol-choline oxidoreductase [Penicillium atrosanguineum]KAJ5296464.1 hypothetical protein N7443_007357 [Penicillium atrosanguineum]KAJ5299232.1 Glucose-methanol-choline oxidoreductase [Penicillium atrosanguineum]
MAHSIEDFASLAFDYIVVGGGTAGLAVAARLSEDPQIKVGVIEAGPSALNSDDGAITVPGRYGETIGSDYDWKFTTSPQPGLNGRSLPWPRGRVLGGTSALNFMAWNRGHRKDYDAWEKLGNPGWGWEDLLPYFLRSETFHPPSAAHQKHYQSSYRAEFNGTEGPVQTTHIKQYGPPHQYWHQTLNELGISSNPDSLAGSNCGVWNLVCTIEPDTQERSYAAPAYYLPVASRPNLYVITETTVLKVLLEQKDGWVATGVRARHDGVVLDIKAVREVIISAGSVQSPQILELSGIGRQDVLEAAGIGMKVDSPNVGENLQDHMMTATIFEVLPTLSSRDCIIGDPILTEAADRAYHASKTGPWTVMPCSVAYCSLSQIIPPWELAEISCEADRITQQTGCARDRLIAQQFKSPRGQIEYIFDVGNWSPYFLSEPGKSYATMLQMLQYPFSRGSVHIPSLTRDHPEVTIDDKPIIDPRYYLDEGEFDKKIMALGQRMADRICSTEPLSKIIVNRVLPPVAELGREEQAYEDFVSNCTVTDWHPIGTCAMGGKEGINNGVVDERLRVYGVRGLRVVDASIMPLQIGAHIQATVYAIAEKGSAMIREDWVK